MISNIAFPGFSGYPFEHFLSITAWLYPGGDVSFRNVYD